MTAQGFKETGRQTGSVGLDLGANGPARLGGMELGRNVYEAHDGHQQHTVAGPPDRLTGLVESLTRSLPQLARSH